MQQTETYKLNLIEKTDTFSPDALNENTRKVEEVLAGEEAARKQKDAYLEGRADGLDQRVTALEVQKIYFGSYVGTGGIRIIELGFDPLAVIVHHAHAEFGVGSTGMVVAARFDTPITGNTSNMGVFMVSGGFRVGLYDRNDLDFNRRGEEYNYIAFR